MNEMKTSTYRSKKKFPGKAIGIMGLNDGSYMIEGMPTKFNSLEEIEKFLEDELELVVPLQ